MKKPRYTDPTARGAFETGHLDPNSTGRYENPPSHAFFAYHGGRAFIATRGELVIAHLRVRRIDVTRHADGSYTVSRRGYSRRLPDFLALEDFAGGAQ